MSETTTAPPCQGPIRAVLFDLDGTLMDSDDQVVAKVERLFSKLHLAQGTYRARRLILGLETPLNLAMTALDMLGLDNAWAAASRLLRRRRVERYAPRFPMIDGTADMLARLKSRYRLGVVTTRPIRDAQAFLDQHALAGLFEVLVTRESTWRLKPHPDPVRHAAKALGLQPGECAMVGDTTVDVRSARRAGACAVAVLCGFGERGELERAGAHVILEHTAQLGTLL